MMAERMEFGAFPEFVEDLVSPLINDVVLVFGSRTERRVSRRPDLVNPIADIDLVECLATRCIATSLRCEPGMLERPGELFQFVGTALTDAAMERA